MTNNDAWAGTEAQRVLENHVVKEFFTATEREIFEQWAATVELDDPVLRERLFALLKNLRDFRAYLEKRVSDGMYSVREHVSAVI